jgi:hypothetical protein
MSVKDPAIREVFVNVEPRTDVPPNMMLCDAEHLQGDCWLVLAKPGPTFWLRGHVVKVRKQERKGTLIATADLGKPH